MTWRRWLSLEARRLGWSFLAQWHRWRMRRLVPRSEAWKAEFRAAMRCHHNGEEVGRVVPPPPPEN